MTELHINVAVYFPPNEQPFVTVEEAQEVPLLQHQTKPLRGIPWFLNLVFNIFLGLVASIIAMGMILWLIWVHVN